jgi:hypothetical protein
VGGIDGEQALASAELWDPKAEAFGPAGDLAGARASHTATALPDGRVLVVGGGAGGEVATAELWESEAEAFARSPEPSPTPTSAPAAAATLPLTADPDALVTDELRVVPGVPPIIGAGSVRIEQGADADSLTVTVDGQLGELASDPVTGEPLSGDRWCLLCLESVQFSPGITVPLDLLVRRVDSMLGGLEGWTMHAGTETSYRDGRPVAVSGVFDVPLDRLTALPAIEAGPEGSRLEMTDGGFILREGAARLVTTGRSGVEVPDPAGSAQGQETPAVTVVPDVQFCSLVADDLAACEEAVATLARAGMLPESFAALMIASAPAETESTAPAKPVATKGKGSKNTKPFELAAGDYEVTLKKSKGCDDITWAWLMHTSGGSASGDIIDQDGYIYGLEEGRYYWETEANDKCKWTYTLTPLE